MKKKQPIEITPELLKSHREKYKLTQAEAADELGVDEATVWRWENWYIPTRGLGLRALERFIATKRRRAA